MIFNWELGSKFYVHLRNHVYITYAGWLSKDESEASPRLTVILSCLMCFGGGVIMTSR